MIDLPNPTRPALVSFWLASSALAGTTVALVTWILDVPQPMAWGVLAAGSVGLPGVLWPSLVRRPYENWNRLARIARRAARLWLTGVAFLIIALVARSGARVAWSAPGSGASGWTPKRPPSPGSHRTTSDVSGAPGSGSGWLRAFAGWARRSGNTWAWSLLPALTLLEVVEGTSTRSLGGNVYTLY